MLKHLALSAALALGACGTLGIGGTTDAMNTAKKGLTAAHLAHDAAAVAMSAAANSGACRGTCALQAKDYLDKSETYLVTADQAVAIGNATTVESEVAAANSFISQAQTLLGAH